ncbi:hypothetical protein Dsin_007479 [Dipteronia sinensis]|uniref:Uncharacterized protein n=1 Tax=Dipteronia sinensis TaxID=43782 RepID=A0AAE0EH49_9ROSI|nr:hypothetical protein Dsin_007479 [Dipteronia sinensis]
MEPIIFQAGIYAVNASDGLLVWKKNFHHLTGLSPNPGLVANVNWTVSRASPTIVVDDDHDLLIIGVHGPDFVVADYWSLWTCLLSSGPIPDADFGVAPMMLSIQAKGMKKDIVAAVQKSGFGWSLDRDNGSILWSTETFKGCTSMAVPGCYYNNLSVLLLSIFWLLTITGAIEAKRKAIRQKGAFCKLDVDGKKVVGPSDKGRPAGGPKEKLSFQKQGEDVGPTEDIDGVSYRSDHLRANSVVNNEANLQVDECTSPSDNMLMKIGEERSEREAAKLKQGIELCIDLRDLDKVNPVYFMGKKSNRILLLKRNPFKVLKGTKCRLLTTGILGIRQ